MRKPHVLFSISFYYPYVSGLSIYAKRLAGGLAASGYHVSILTTQYQKSLPRQEVLQNVDVSRVPHLMQVSKGFIMPLYLWYAFKAVRQADHVVIHLPQLEGFVVALFALVLKKKLLCVYHCEVHLPRSFRNRFIEGVLHMCNALSLLLADTVVTYTEDFAKNAKLLRFVRKKVKTIYPPIPVPSQNQKVKQHFELLLANHKENFRVGIAARIASEKGIEHVLLALPAIEKAVKKGVTLLIAGPNNPVGEESYRKKITPLIEKYEKQIVFLGTVVEEDMGAFYSLLDVLVLPSVNTTESFGMVQVEAMMMGTPVVASNLPGVREAVNLTKMGEISTVADVNDLADKVARILLQKKKYTKSLGEITRIFSYERTITFYKKLLSRN